MPLLLAFIDDLTLFSSSVAGAKTLLHQCSKGLNWASLDFWEEKSRTIFIIKGRSMNKTPFCVSEPKNSTDLLYCIPSIHSRPIKFLRHIIDDSISDRNSLNELEITGLGIIYISQSLILPNNKRFPHSSGNGYTCISEHHPLFICALIPKLLHALHLSIV